MRGRLSIHRGFPQSVGPAFRSKMAASLYSLDDEDGWKMKLLQELKAAGFPINANEVLQA